MKYLQASFSIESPAKVFGCAACIYGEQHGYEHTYEDGCHADLRLECPCWLCQGSPEESD
jgi:hypothetical protein